MKKRRVLKAAALPLALMMLIVLILFFDFASRRGSPTLDVTIEDLELADNRFTMTAGQEGNSGMSFRRYNWEIRGGTLYITFFCGLVRDDFGRATMDVEIEDDDLRKVWQICLRDRSSTKLIFSR